MQATEPLTVICSSLGALTRRIYRSQSSSAKNEQHTLVLQAWKFLVLRVVTTLARHDKTVGFGRPIELPICCTPVDLGESDPVSVRAVRVGVVMSQRFAMSDMHAAMKEVGMRAQKRGLAFIDGHLALPIISPLRQQELFARACYQRTWRAGCYHRHHLCLTDEVDTPTCTPSFLSVTAVLFVYLHRLA